MPLPGLISKEVFVRIQIKLNSKLGPSVAIKYFVFKYHPTITDKRFCWLLTRMEAGYMQSKVYLDHGGWAAPMNENPDILILYTYLYHHYIISVM